MKDFITKHFPGLVPIWEDPQRRKGLLMFLGTGVILFGIIIYTTIHLFVPEKSEAELMTDNTTPEISNSSNTDNLSDASMANNYGTAQRAATIADMWEDEDESTPASLASNDVVQKQEETPKPKKEEHSRESIYNNLFGDKNEDGTLNDYNDEPEKKTATKKSSSTKTLASPTPARVKHHRETAAERQQRINRQADSILLAQGYSPELVYGKEYVDEQKRKEQAKADSIARVKAAQEEAKRQSIVGRKAVFKKSGGISSLDATELGGLEQESQFVNNDLAHPYKVTFVRSGKIRNGDRVTLRILEDIVVNNILIPANTHLMAIASIGQRMTLQVSSLEYNGKILPLEMTAYDNDGGEGLYCAQTNANKTKKQVANQGVTLLGSAVSSVFTGYTGQVLQQGQNISSQEMNNQSVEVVSGYIFYLMQSGGLEEMKQQNNH